MPRVLLLLVPVLLLSACDVPAYDYYVDAKPIIDANCVTCHQDGNIGPFALTTYDEVKTVAELLPPSIEADTMPPWGANPECNDYLHDSSLTAQDKEILLTWLDQGVAPGDPTTAVKADEVEPMTFDLTLPLPEPYTPNGQLDDYRCILVDWPLEEAKYAVGFGVTPDRTDLVHHVVAYIADPSIKDALEELDASDPGLGYSCFGAPTPQDTPGVIGLGVDQRWLGQWAPGPTGRPFPPGTGILIEPGSTMIVQMHYNTATADPSPDQSSFEVQLAEEVDKPATVIPFLDFGWALGSVPMTIPAGAADAVITHEQDISNSTLDWFAGTIGLENGDPFVVQEVFFHMHTLGAAGRLDHKRVANPTSDDQCLLDLPRWDFNWQNSYQLQEPRRVDPGDTLQIECRFDNSDGGSEVGFGDGTFDEMCLAILYVTGI